MKILYDHQIFCYQRYGGISRYFNELIREVSKNNEVLQPVIPAGYNYLSPQPGPKSKFVKRIINKLYLTYDGNKRARTLVNIERDSIGLLEKGDYDIFHPTYYNPYFLMHIKSKPFVLTIYDMIHEIYPEYFPLNEKTSAWKKELAEKATKIIAISENTKMDIIKYYGIEDKKIEVIYLGNSLLGLHGRIDQNIIDSLPKKYVLFIGSRLIYKNFYLFVDAIASLLQNDKELNLVCIGGGRFSDEECTYFNSFGVEKQIFHYTADDDTLSEVYKRAIAFVYPSLYEGFGLPILEAFSCSCPAILSNTSSMPEVAGDAAAYFYPKDIASMRETISRTIYDRELLKTLKLKGHDRLRKYSWENCAEKTMLLYKSLM